MEPFFLGTGHRVPCIKVHDHMANLEVEQGNNGELTGLQAGLTLDLVWGEDVSQNSMQDGSEEETDQTSEVRKA